MFNFIRRLFKKKVPDKPRTYEEAVEFVCLALRGTSRAELDSPFFHMTAGMHFRNTLGLWDKTSPLHAQMVARFGLCHADDTGTLITNAAKARIAGQPYSPGADVERFKNHWRQLGYDPSTMEPL